MHYEKKEHLALKNHMIKNMYVSNTGSTLPEYDRRKLNQDIP